MVTGIVTISVHTMVEAEDEEAAKAQAQERGLMSLCHGCATADSDEEWVTSGELDGEVDNVEVEEDSE